MVKPTEPSNRIRWVGRTGLFLLLLLPLAVLGVRVHLLDFGLGPYCFAHRPADGTWSDPADQRQAFARSRLEPSALESACPAPETASEIP